MNNNLHLGNTLRYFSTDIICSEMRTVFRERSSRRKILRFEIASFDKFPCIFSRQIKAIVFIIYSNIFSEHVQFWKLDNISRQIPSFSSWIFSYVSRSKQCRARENIWWITISINCQQQRRKKVMVVLQLSHACMYSIY